MTTSLNKPLLTNAVDELYTLLSGILQEQPEESGHPILNRYYITKGENDDHTIVRPGNIEVTTISAAQPATAQLFSVMSPLTAQSLMNLLYNLKEEAGLSAKTIDSAETLAQELSYSIRSNRTK